MKKVKLVLATIAIFSTLSLTGCALFDPFWWGGHGGGGHGDGGGDRGGYGGGGGGRGGPGN
ncbi:MAG: hypothetical protein QM666_08600 [Acinetobacter sp.]